MHMINDSEPNSETTREVSVGDGNEEVCEREVSPAVGHEDDSGDTAGFGQKRLSELKNVVLQPKQINEARKRLQNRICGLPEVASHPAAVARELFKMGPVLSAPGGAG